MSDLSEAWASALADFEHHLGAERDLSAHSVRAYLTDLAARGARHQARHRRPGGADPALTAQLPGQPADPRTGPHHAGATSHVGAGVHRVAEPHRPRAHDAGALLASPKAHRELPVALGHDDIRALLDATAAAIADDGPIGLRDLALLELLYATGIRVGELCGLDIDDLDRERRVVRVFGKGRKERAVPYRAPAGDALTPWLDRGRPELVTEASGAALFLGARGGRLDQRTVRRIVHERLAAVDGAPTSGRTGCATPPPPTCWRAAPTCAASRRSSAMPRSAPRRSTRT